MKIPYFQLPTEQSQSMLRFSKYDKELSSGRDNEAKATHDQDHDLTRLYRAITEELSKVGVWHATHPNISCEVSYGANSCAMPEFLQMNNELARINGSTQP